MSDRTIMRAIATGMVKRADGSGRDIVKKGVSTAHAGHPIATGSPHLWREIVPDFRLPDEPQAEVFEAAAGEAGLMQFEEFRRLAQGLADRGFVMPETGPDDDLLIPRIVDMALALADEVTGRGPGPDMVAVNEPLGARPDQALPPAAPDQPAPDPVETQDAADPTTPEGRKAIRRWAADSDIEVAATGPLPKDVVDQYVADHQGGAPGGEV